MIPKGTNVVVNFYVTNVEGIPLSTANGITPYYRLNGGASNSLSVTISSLGSDAPGWFRFSTSYFNNSTGNLFITFSNDSGYAIMPWEDDIVQIGGATTSEIATAVWSTNNINGSAIALAAWGPEAYLQIQSIKDLQAVLPSYHTAIEQIVPDVWGYTIGNPAVSASTYLSSICTIPHDVWNYNLESDLLHNPSRIVSDILTAIPSSNDIGSLVWGSTFMEDVVDLEVEPNDVITERIWTYGGRGDQTHQYSTVFEILDATPTVNAIAGGVWGYDLSTATPAVPASTYLRSTYGLPSRVWSYSWGTPTAVSASVYLGSIYNNTSSITIPTPPTTSAIATSVWAHTSRSITTTLVNDGAVAGNETYIATGSNVSGVPSAVWTYNIGPNATTASTYLGSVGSIPHDVWTYKSGETETSSDRSLTYYPAVPDVPTVESIWNYSVDNVSMKSYMISTDGIAANVWTQTSRSLTTTFIDDGSTEDHYFARLDDIPGKDEIAMYVWDYSIPQVNATPISMRSYLISTYNNTSSISIPTVPTALEIAESVWTYSTTGNPSSDRSLTFYPGIPTFPPLNLIADAVWSHSLHIGPVEQLTYANMDSIVGSIYDNTSSISIPTVPSAGAIAASVWTYGDDDDAVNRIVNNTIPQVSDIWSNSSGWRTLTSYPVFPTTTSIATSVWNYAINGKSASSYISSIANLPTSASIWSYTSRSLTLYPEYPDISSIQAGLATTSDITALESYGDSHWSTATGFATLANLTSMYSDIVSYGDSNWSTATGFAVPGDAMTLTNAYDAAKVAPPSVEAIQSGLATADDITNAQSAIIGVIPDASAITLAAWGDSSERVLTSYPEYPSVEAIQAGLATTSDIDSLISYGDSHWSTANGGISAADIWTHPSRSLTTNVFGAAASSKLAVIGDFTGLATAANVQGVISHGDESWLTATGFATPGAAMTLTAAYDAAKVVPPSVEAIQAGLATTSDLTSLQAAVSKLTGGLFDWSIDYYTLTVSVGQSVYSYSVTRDISGDIIAIRPST